MVLFLHVFLTFSQSNQDSIGNKIAKAESLLRERKVNEGKEILTKVLHPDSPILTDSLKLKASLGLARALHMNHRLDSSLIVYYQALDIAKSISGQHYLAEIYMGIGVLYAQTKNFRDAVENLQRASQFATTDQQKLQININLGNTRLDMDQGEQALTSFETALTLAESLQLAPVMAVIHTNLSNLFIKQEKWDKAISQARRSLELRQKLDQAPSVITYNNLGYALAQSGKYEQSKNAYIKVLPMASASERVQLFKNLKDLALLENDYPSAIRYYDQYTSLKDTIKAQELDTKIKEITESYEGAEKSRKILSLQTENQTKRLQLILVIAGSLMTLLLASLATYLFIKNERVKRELAHAKTKNQLLLAQLNPHFLFNALQHVQHFLYKNEKDISMTYLSSLARLMRMVLEHSELEEILLEEEIELLHHYLTLQRLASDHSFEFDIRVSTDVDPTTIELPTMLLQPVVENACKHGTSQRDNALIKININQKGNKLYIEIIDNGSGVTDVRDNPNKIHRSMGSKLIKNRIEEINKLYPNFVVLNIQSASDDPQYPGTRVSFIFDLDKRIQR